MDTASDYRLYLDSTPIYLNNQRGVPTIGGNPHSPTATPLILVAADWRPGAPEASLVAGGDSQDLMGLTYAPLVETIPLLCRAQDAEQLAQILALFNRHARLTSTPGVLWCQPKGVAAPILFAVSRVEARAVPLQNTRDPGEGASDVAIQLKLRRSPIGGAAALSTLASALSITNSSLTAFGAIAGDMAAEGQPLQIRLDKPTAQSPIRAFFASVQSRTTATIGNLVTTTSTSGAAFTASSSISASPLRAADGLHLHVVARLTGLTTPSKAQLRVRAESSTAATLWQGPWVDLDTGTSTQLVDLDGSTLDALRLAVGSAPAIVLRAELRSKDGTSVAATLASLEALWCYDWTIVELGAALAAGQRLYGLGANLVPGGPYLPLDPAEAIVADSSDVPVQLARVRGQLPRAIQGASLYVAWIDAGGAHTSSDTANLTLQMAPLWRSPRPLST